MIDIPSVLPNEMRIGNEKKKSHRRKTKRIEQKKNKKKNTKKRRMRSMELRAFAFSPLPPPPRRRCRRGPGFLGSNASPARISGPDVAAMCALPFNQLSCQRACIGATRKRIEKPERAPRTMAPYMGN